MENTNPQATADGEQNPGVGENFYHLENPVQVDPSQTAMFEGEEPTRLDISHEAAEAPVTEVPVETAVVQEEEGVTTGNKAKVLAALAIVAVAGYIAYWVQEPLQIKADVLGSSTPSSTSSTPTSTSKDVAASDSSTTPTGDAASSATGVSKNVDVSLFGFEPAVLKVDKGTTVIWTNTSSEDQTIIGSSKNGDSFTSPVLTSGDTFSHKFDKDGDYEYYSTYNPALKASITVGLGGAAATTTPDSTSAPDSTTSPDLKGSAPASDATPADTTTSAPAVVTPPATDTAAPTDLTASPATSTPVVSPAVTNTSDLTAANLKAAAEDSLKPAAATPKRLAKTGPEDAIYVFALLAIAYFNRKKLLAVFNK